MLHRVAVGRISGDGKEANIEYIYMGGWLLGREWGGGSSLPGERGLHHIQHSSRHVTSVHQ